jgi:hypothetical protein
MTDKKRLDWLNEYLLSRPMWSSDGRPLIELMTANGGPHKTLRDAIDAAQGENPQ